MLSFVSISKQCVTHAEILVPSISKIYVVCHAYNFLSLTGYHS